MSTIIPGQLSVVIPAYNEEEAIEGTIRTTVEVLNGTNFEVVVVDDGSADRTRKIIQQISTADNRVQAVHYDLNLGKGHALRYGFQFTHGERVAFLDADLDLHPRHLLQFQTIMTKTGADVVIGCKRHSQSKLDYPWHRRIISSVYFFLVKLMFGLPIRDTQTGVKLFKREALEASLLRLIVKRFANDLELLVVAHRLGYRIVEAPVVVTYTRGKLGRIGIMAILTMWWDTMAIFYRMYLLHYYDRK